MAGQRALLVLDNAASSAPGHAAAARRRQLPGAGHQPPAPGRPARRRSPRCCWRSCRRSRPGRCSCGWPPAPPPARRRRCRSWSRLAGYLPLAISLLARVYARHPSWTLADLAAETRASLLTLTAENDSVAAAFEVSYRHLDPGQQQFFRRLGLHPGTDDRRLRRRRAGRHPAWPRRPRLLDALHGEGLLTETGYRRYGMHDLIRRYARDLAAADPAADRDQALGRLLDYYQHTAALAEARLARQARSSRPGPARPAAAGGGPRPGRTARRRWPGRGPSAPTCSPASTTPPAPASTPGSSP